MKDLAMNENIIDDFEFDINDLVDIRNIKINVNKPIQEKIIDFVRQVKNPYLFKVGDVVVKVNFNNNGSTFQEKFENYLKECIKN